MPTYRIHFPSTSGPNGLAFAAEADADTEAHAVRAVLEAVAAQGIPLEYVALANLQDLKGAMLDGLTLTNCQLQNVSLAGVSLRGASFTDTTLDHVFADHSTCLDGATLENVRFVGSTVNGMVAKGIQARALRFEDTSAIGLAVEGASFTSVRVVRSDLSKWKAHMAHLNMFENAPKVIASADLSENQKAALLTLVHVGGNRVAAQTYFDALEAQDVAASA